MPRRRPIRLQPVATWPPASARALSGSLKHVFVPPVDSFLRVNVLHIQRRSRIWSVGTPVTPHSVLENNEGSRLSEMKMVICRKTVAAVFILNFFFTASMEGVTLRTDTAWTQPGSPHQLPPRCYKYIKKSNTMKCVVLSREIFCDLKTFIATFEHVPLLHVLLVSPCSLKSSTSTDCTSEQWKQWKPLKNTATAIQSLSLTSVGLFEHKLFSFFQGCL